MKDGLVMLVGGLMMVSVFDEERTFTMVLRDIFNDSTLCQSLCRAFQRWHHGLHAQQMRRHSVDSNCLGWQNVWRQWPDSCWQLCHIRTCHGNVDSSHSMSASLAQHIQHYVVPPALHCYNSCFSCANNTHGFGVDRQTMPVSQWINLLKLSINWHPRRLPELVDGLHDIVQLQTKDLWCVRLIYSHGNHTFAPEFIAFTMPHAVWQLKSEKEKDGAIHEFLAYTARTKCTTVTSSSGVLTVTSRLNIATKPGQQTLPHAKRAKCDSTQFCRSWSRATTFFRGRQ